MAGKVTKKEIADAITSYCAKHGAEAAYDEATDSYHLKDQNDLECVFGPGLKCSSESVLDELKELLVSMRMDSEPARGSNLPAKRPGGTISRSQGEPAQGSALETVRRTIDSKDQTYNAGGNEEAYAAVKIKAFEEMGGSYQIMSSEVKPDMARYLIRGTLPDGRFNESEYSVFQDQWQRDMAWDMVDKQMEAGRNILDLDCPALENGMPNLIKGAMMKIKKGAKKGEVVSGWIDVPAAYHIATTVNKLWKFQRVQAQTKAKAKIAKEMVGAAFGMLDQGELEDEQRERDQVSEARA